MEWRQVKWCLGILLCAGWTIGQLGCDEGERNSAQSGTDVTWALTPVATEVLLLLDRSASMKGNGLLEPVADAVSVLTDEMEGWSQFGLMLFPGSECESLLSPVKLCDVPKAPAVPIGGPDAHAEIADLLSGWRTGVRVCGQTPTAASLRVAHDYLMARQSERDQLVVLLTDGEPDCNGASDGGTCDCLDYDRSFCDERPGDCLDRDNMADCTGKSDMCLDADGAMDAVSLLADAHIPVFVVALAANTMGHYDAMDQLATAGLTEKALPVRHTRDIAMWLNYARSGMYTCQFDVDWSGLAGEGLPNSAQAAAGQISLSFGGLPLVFDAECETEEGFYVGPDERITLCKGACDIQLRRHLGQVEFQATVR